MTPLASTLLYMHVVWVTPALEPVYTVQLRGDALGAEQRAAELARELELAAELAGVPLELLAAVEIDESDLDPLRVGAVGELGGMQLHPLSRWGRGWLAECERANAARGTSSWWACEASNVLWGAYALRDALAACGGDEWAALGFYRSGRCVRGPRGAATLELAEWLAWRLAS